VRSTVAKLVEGLNLMVYSSRGVIPWSSPVPYFGSPSSAIIGTVGLNPSNREFVDSSGNELDGPARRFHTLNSLGLAR
jgi:hypothetical protein